MRIFGGRLGWALLFVLGAVYPLATDNDYHLTIHDPAGSPPSMKALAAREDTRWHAGRRSQYE